MNTRPRRAPRTTSRAPVCTIRQRSALRSIDLEEKADHGKAGPSIEFQIHVHHDPAAISPFAQQSIERWNEQQNGEQHADGIGEDQPEKTVPCGAGNGPRSTADGDAMHQAMTGS